MTLAAPYSPPRSSSTGRSSGSSAAIASTSPPAGSPTGTRTPARASAACSEARSGSRREGRTTAYGPLESWFESGPEPVLAEASATEQTAFVRVMVLPREWEGRRTIAYVDPADAEKPKTQRASILLERTIELP